ncbi:Uncharacterised protein [Bordetella ansorpii]|uniref:Lipoprotein n=1 Tax=Bordetella ansorpii TaxID=288768 RepID=A0A157SG87_9BORD|nr:hypothetical protein [Bordetella ansorpii]SAI69445.1 Uncharacterised protein [Bordetella ansorpii]
MAATRLLLLAALSLILTPALSHAQGLPAAEHYVGIARTDDGREAYREAHWVTRADGRQSRLVLYLCPDGRPFARKWVRGPLGGSTPDFALEDARDGYLEGARAGTVYTRDNATAQQESARVSAPADAVIDAGFDDYLRTHWDALSNGGAIHFLVPGRHAFLPLRIRAEDGQLDGVPVRRFHLRLDAWYGFAAPKLEVAYRVADRRLLRFTGIGSLRDGNGGSQAVRIDFPDKLRAPAPTRQDIDAAATQPLVSRCTQ